MRSICDLQQFCFFFNFLTNHRGVSRLFCSYFKFRIKREKKTARLTYRLFLFSFDWRHPGIGGVLLQINRIMLRRLEETKDSSWISWRRKRISKDYSSSKEGKEGMVGTFPLVSPPVPSLLRPRLRRRCLPHPNNI